MIKANELRIGNWLKPTFNGINDMKPYKINGMFIRQCESNDPVSNWEGIPLTPEILEKAGFGQVAHSHMMYRFEDFCLSNWEGDKWMWTDRQGFDKYPRMKLITYLHQLQNLYFALTGEELEINL